ncbi:MAG TPA: RloB family protein [Mucilaginibacter sp.]|nr:RloB family protein [Mucilaginibacter sp.]
MSKAHKIGNSLKDRFLRKETVRKVGNRQKRVYFLIVCEGIKTEPNYFNAFKEELPNGTLVVSDMTVFGAGKNTKSLIDFTIKSRHNFTNNFDKVWAVFDKDSFTDDQFNSAIIKARDNDINCAWSNEAFELWFLLHFQLINHAMSRADYQAYFEREVKRASNKDYSYKKNDPDTFKILKTYGSMANAIKWARKLEAVETDQKYATHNPCTKVHELISQLLDPSAILSEVKSI